jgi:hypothetical protein
VARGLLSTAMLIAAGTYLILSGSYLMQNSEGSRRSDFTIMDAKICDELGNNIAKSYRGIKVLPLV